nr:hypothetical protein [Actinomycetes bacterium]
VAPAAVVLVMSAVAPVTESDCALAELVTAQTEVVVAVVSKVDDHRDWRGVLALNRERLAGRTGRLRHLPWAPAAAAPRWGAPLIGDLVELLERRLADPESARRNSLRASEWRLRAEMSRLAAAVKDAQQRAQVVRERRADLLRQRRLLGPESTIALRSRIQQARVVLMFAARTRCAVARAELTEKTEKVVGTGRRPAAEIEEQVRRRCREIVAAVDDDITVRVRRVAADFGLAEPPRPPPERMAGLIDPPVASGRVETQLTAVLGVGFGLGVALLVSRLFAGLASSDPAVGLVAGGVVGLAITVWVVRIRGLLHHRAMLDRWVVEVTGMVRSGAEERIATRMLAAEAALSTEHVASVDGQRRALGRRIAAIEAELAEHAEAIARAEAVRDHEMPSLRRALRAVCEALAERNPG